MFLARMLHCGALLIDGSEISIWRRGLQPTAAPRGAMPPASTACCFSLRRLQVHTDAAGGDVRAARKFARCVMAASSHLTRETGSKQKHQAVQQITARLRHSPAGQRIIRSLETCARARAYWGPQGTVFHVYIGPELPDRGAFMHDAPISSSQKPVLYVRFDRL